MSVTALARTSLVISILLAVATPAPVVRAESLPEFTISKANPDFVYHMQAGNTYGYHLYPVNNQPGTTATGVTVRDELPAGVSFVTFGSVGGGFSCSHQAGVVTCTGVTVSSQADIAVNVRASSPDPAVTPLTVTNRAVVDLDDTIVEGNEANNTSSAVSSSIVYPDLSMVKFGPGIMQAGSTYRYDLYPANNQQETTATGVTVRDELPAAVSFVSFGTVQGCGPTVRVGDR